MIPYSSFKLSDFYIYPRLNFTVAHIYIHIPYMAVRSSGILPFWNLQPPSAQECTPMLRSSSRKQPKISEQLSSSGVDPENSEKVV